MHIKTIDSIRSLTSARGVVLAVLAALICMAILGGCGSSKPSTASTHQKTNLDTKRVALAIEQSIHNERHLRAKVLCPTTVPQEAGRTFLCVATTFVGKRRGESTPFEVTVQNDKGYVTYQAK